MFEDSVLVILKVIFIFYRLKQLSMYGKIEPTEISSGITWNLVDTAHRLEAKLLQTLRRCTSLNCFFFFSLTMRVLFRPEVVTMRENIASMARLVLVTDGGQRLHGRLAALNHIAGSVLRKMSRKGQLDAELNAVSDLKVAKILETSLFDEH